MHFLRCALYAAGSACTPLDVRAYLKRAWRDKPNCYLHYEYLLWKGRKNTFKFPMFPLDLLILVLLEIRSLSSTYINARVCTSTSLYWKLYGGGSLLPIVHISCDAQVW